MGTKLPEWNLLRLAAQDILTYFAKRALPSPRTPTNRFLFAARWVSVLYEQLWRFVRRGGYYPPEQVNDNCVRRQTDFYFLGDNTRPYGQILNLLCRGRCPHRPGGYVLFSGPCGQRPLHSNFRSRPDPMDNIVNFALLFHSYFPSPLQNSIVAV